jgi:hypothetical protein
MSKCRNVVSTNSRRVKSVGSDVDADDVLLLRWKRLVNLIKQNKIENCFINIFTFYFNKQKVNICSESQNRMKQTEKSFLIAMSTVVHVLSLVVVGKYWKIQKHQKWH